MRSIYLRFIHHHIYKFPIPTFRMKPCTRPSLSCSAVGQPHSLSFPSVGVLCNRMTMVRKMYTDDERSHPATRGPYRALCATQDFLERLRTSSALTPAECATIRVCTIKDVATPFLKTTLEQVQTVKINTSVTFGAAVTFLESHPSHTHVLIMNCGTGTVKFQVYGRDHSMIVRPVYEFKPSETQTGPLTSLSGLQVGAYQPTKQHLLSSKVFIATTTLWLTEFVSFLHTQGIDNIAITALVTGSIRAFWEQSGPIAQHFLDRTISITLQAVCPQILPASGTASFFLTQSTEGLYEFEALTAMVSAESAQEPMCLLLGIGIGRGSTQLPFRTCEDQVSVATLPTQGMQNPDLATDMLWTGVSEWKASNGCSLMEEFTSMVRRVITQGKIPVIALKSGALIAFTDMKRRATGLRQLSQQIFDETLPKGGHQGRSLALTVCDHIMWDIVLYVGIRNEDAYQRMMAAIWTYAPERGISIY